MFNFDKKKSQSKEPFKKKSKVLNSLQYANEVDEIKGIRNDVVELLNGQFTER
jgi:hypothetical protein